MAWSQILLTILAALSGVFGKVYEFLVSLTITNYALLGATLNLLLRMIFVVIIITRKVLVWIVVHVKNFVIGLLHVIPLLFKAGFPNIAHQPSIQFPVTIKDMITDQPCPPHGTADFMAYLIDNNCATAPFQFCLWLSKFASRVAPFDYGFTIWGPMNQQKAEDMFAPGSAGARELYFVKLDQAELTPWELDDQPPTSVLSATSQAEAVAVTTHLYKSYGLANPFHKTSGRPYAKEMQMVLATFFASGGPLKLDMLSDIKIAALLVALKFTGHSTAFQVVYDDCQSVLREKFDEFHRQANLIDMSDRVGDVLRLGITISSLALLTSIILVLVNVPTAILLLPAFALFVGFLITIYALNYPCFVVHGFSHRNLYPWEVFLTATDYVARRKEAGFFVGIAKKQALMSTQWSPEHTTRIFLWNNLCLALGEKFEKTVGGVYALLFFNDHLVNKFHEYLHKKFEKEVWVEKPAIYQLHSMVFYSAAFLSLFPTSFFTVFFLYCNWDFTRG